MRFLAPSFFVLWVLLGCGGSGRGDPDGDADADADADADGDDCVDRDGDGAGQGAGCEADDCDDTDPETTDECGDDCGEHPQRRGCPCADGAVTPCYHGPEGTGNVGTCRAGLQRCEGGVLGECDDQILPAQEVCDELDDDCDGEVDDDGVLSECGTCGACEQHCAGPEDGCEDFLEEEESGGVAETAEGYLVLDGTASNLHVMWPSSSGTGQVLRVDTQTYEILGAYWTGPDHGEGGWLGGDSPSRTAVDDYGSVVIANRAFGAQASITKVASSDELCVDSNGNGAIDTSHGWDELLDFSAHDDWEDECILWHTTVGDMNDAVARAVAIHTVVGLDAVAVDMGWVGMYTEGRFLQFDETTGELTGVEAPTPGCQPYGGALDRDGWLWMTCLSTIVGRFDTASPEDSYESFSVPGMGSAYRVIVDENNA
ncbi:MAG: hypothetical protein HYY06_23315, partial [Deltaproteobacteria bacterium]|nr:hypothetical protein [Deltaproteobacteria bacterium]